MKFIKIGLITSGCLILLNMGIHFFPLKAYQEPQPPTREIKNKNVSINMETVTHDGHVYVIWQNPWNSVSGCLHSPNCPCILNK